MGSALRSPPTFESSRRNRDHTVKNRGTDARHLRLAHRRRRGVVCRHPGTPRLSRGGGIASDGVRQAGEEGWYEVHDRLPEPDGAERDALVVAEGGPGRGEGLRL